MKAIIGGGESVINTPIMAYEYNYKTSVITLLHPDMSKTYINTLKDKVAIALDGVIVDIFKGDMNVRK